jgi:hypothetical protein
VESLTGPNSYTLLSHLSLRSLFVASYDAQGLRWKYSNSQVSSATIILEQTNYVFYEVRAETLYASLGTARYKITKPQQSEGNIKLKEKLITGPRWAPDTRYGNLALQVGGVSDETVKYGREFCGTSTEE